MKTDESKWQLAEMLGLIAAIILLFAIAVVKSK